MNYKYENYELESLKRYLNSDEIKTFINDIINNSNSGVLKKLNSFNDFKILYTDILNIMSLSCKYGAHDELKTSLFTSRSTLPIVRYQSYLNDKEDVHFMLSNFAILKDKKHNDDVSIFMDENFVSDLEVPFIDIYNLLGTAEGAFVLPPFVDAVHSFDEENYEILPNISPGEEIDDSFDRVSEEELYKYYMSVINNNSNYRSLSHRIKNDLRNNLTDLHYKYMIEPKIEMVDGWRKSL